MVKLINQSLANYRVGASCDGQHLVANQMKADGGWRGGVEVEGLHDLADVGLQLIPAIGLGEDALAQSFGGIASIGLLHQFKDEFLHALCTPLANFVSSYRDFGKEVKDEAHQ